MKSQLAEAATAAPPISIAGMTFLGYGVSDWVQAVALLWLLIQIGYFVYTKIIKRDK